MTATPLAVDEAPFPTCFSDAEAGSEHRLEVALITVVAPYSRAEPVRVVRRATLGLRREAQYTHCLKISDHRQSVPGVFDGYQKRERGYSDSSPDMPEPVAVLRGDHSHLRPPELDRFGCKAEIEKAKKARDCLATINAMLPPDAIIFSSIGEAHRGFAQTVVHLEHWMPIWGAERQQRIAEETRIAEAITFIGPQSQCTEAEIRTAAKQHAKGHTDLVSMRWADEHQSAWLTINSHKVLCSSQRTLRVFTRGDPYAGIEQHLNAALLGMNKCTGTTRGNQRLAHGEVAFLVKVIRSGGSVL
jgi:hypothetical protein